MKPFVVLEPYLRAVPERWEVHQLRRISQRIEDANSGAEAPLLSLTIRGELSSRTDDVQPPSNGYLLKYGLVQPGDLVVNPMWLSGGAIGVSNRSGAVSPEYRIYRFAGHVHPRFAHHLVRSDPYMHQYRLLVRAETTFDRRVTKEDFRDLPILVPPLPVQRAIADFLDSETARIDTLIVKKRRLQELSTEHFRSLVSATVNLGSPVALRRTIQLRTSGPRGWADRVGDAGAPFIRSQNLRRDRIELDLTKAVFVNPPETPEALRSRTRAGDVLVGITGANAGWVGIVREQAAGGYVSQHVAVLRPSGVRPEWLAYSLFAHQAQEQLLGGQYGGTKTQLGLDELAELSIRIPSPQDQETALALLNTNLTVTRRTEAALAQQIELLQEHRQALIAAAVTGELEVPGVAA